MTTYRFPAVPLVTRSTLGLPIGRHKGSWFHHPRNDLTDGTCAAHEHAPRRERGFSTDRRCPVCRPVLYTLHFARHRA